MHDGRIIPAHHIARLPPLDAEQVLVLRGVREQALDQFRAVGLLDPTVLWLPVDIGIFQMVQVVRDVQVRSPTGFVALDDPVPAERVGFRVDRGEILGLRARFASAVPQRIGPDVVVLDELASQVVGKFVEGRARVGEVGVAPVAGRWELVGAKERVARAPRVEGRVAMEEGVSLAKSK
jgi:hypothetical protein